jgi:hypothetical protein
MVPRDIFIGKKEGTFDATELHELTIVRQFGQREYRNDGSGSRHLNLKTALH